MTLEERVKQAKQDAERVNRVLVAAASAAAAEGLPAVAIVVSMPDGIMCGVGEKTDGHDPRAYARLVLHGAAALSDHFRGHIEEALADRSRTLQLKVEESLAEAGGSVKGQVGHA